MTVDVEKELKLIKQHLAQMASEMAEMRQQIDKLYEYDAERSAKEFLDKEDTKSTGN